MQGETLNDSVFDVILRNGTIVNHSGVNKNDLGILNGKIWYIGDLSQAKAVKDIDCSNLHILPGVIDSQVHFREPGLEHKEDLETGSLSAVLGGVTTVFEMPNTNPLTITAEAVADKVRRAHHRMHCDFAFWVGGCKENVEEIEKLENLPAVAGIKIFVGSSTGSLLLEDQEVLDKILSKTKRRVAFHSELESRLREREYLRKIGDPSTHPIWRDELVALQSTKNLVDLAKKNNANIHILHVSTSAEIEFLKYYKDLVTCEVTPHHLSLCSEDYKKLGTLIQMNPPIRDKSHQDSLWYGVEQSIIDVIGSDHAPHTIEEKQKIYPDSPSGMTGVQTILPIMLDHVNAGRLTLPHLVDLTSYNPSKVFSIKSKGRIAVGYDADLAIIDMNRTEKITNQQIGSKAGWTPYDGKIVKGWVVGTFLRGHCVVWEGSLQATNLGEMVQFNKV
ncbi:dihydroorotase [Bartonella sp. DGB1]|uniref:dihydroorotase n=1 Tax=Bartonella sp. DGB1 TaxID=3239807 RepID=UPI0035265E73